MATAFQDLKKRHLLLVSDKKSSFPELWKDFLEFYPDITAVNDKYNNLKLSYKQLYEYICWFASGLQHLGLEKGDHICLFSENSSKWLIADQAVLTAGAVNAVRGSQTPCEEFFYIIEHSDSKALIAENLETINKLAVYLENHPPEFIVCLSEEEIPAEIRDNLNVYSFNQVIAKGKRECLKPVSLKRDDPATIVYTSGTTASPKGVVITHGNFLSQLTDLTDVLDFTPGETALNLLPIWHIYERTCEYYLLSRGITLNYTNVQNFKNDINDYKPNYLIAVPRIWEAIYSSIQNEMKKQPALKQKFINFLLKAGEVHIKSRRILNNRCIDNIRFTIKGRIKAFIEFSLTSIFYKLAQKLVYSRLGSALGGNFKLGISGGGALAHHLEDFYEAADLEIFVGYGLTETSPVLTIRNKDNNLRKSAGKPLNQTEIKIIDPKTGKKLGFMETGLVMARGPQVMKEYYKHKEATDKILSADGWLNTGDLGWLTPGNDLVLTGRNKDVIVLSNGENVEPQPLEEACLTSPFINQIMLVGQDKSHLGALISPNIETVRQWAQKQDLQYADSSHIYSCPKIRKLFKKELKQCLQKRSNARVYEKVKCFKLLEEPFTVENGLLTRTMKVKKVEIQKKYRDKIEEMFKI